MNGFSETQYLTPPNKETPLYPETASCYCCEKEFKIEQMRAEKVSKGVTYYYCQKCDNSDK